MGWQTTAVTVLRAGNTIINPNGLFTYSPSPGAGNLVSSDANPGVTADQYGNVIPAPGYTSYVNDGAFFAAVNVGNGVINWFEAATEAGPWSLISTIGFGFGAGVGTIILSPGSPGNIQLGNLATPIPIADPVITTLPTDNNSGSTWVSGERAFMNNNWVTNINNNFSNIITTLRNAGILQ